MRLDLTLLHLANKEGKRERGEAERKKKKL